MWDGNAIDFTGVGIALHQPTLADRVSNTLCRMTVMCCAWNDTQCACQRVYLSLYTRTLDPSNRQLRPIYLLYPKCVIFDDIAWVFPGKLTDKIVRYIRGFICIMVKCSLNSHNIIMVTFM